MKAHLDVHARSNPFQGVDGAAVKRGVEFTGGDIGDVDAEFGKDLAGDAGNTHFQSFQVIQRLDFLAEPAAHLDAGIAAGEGVDAEFVVTFLHQLHAAAVIEPGVLLVGVHAEGHGGENGGGGVLALPVVGGGMAHLVLAALDHVEDLQRLPCVFPLLRP